MDSHVSLLPHPRRHGDADAAFGEMVHEHAAMVLATARRITGDAALAEDVMQETFLELSRSSPGSVRSVAAWLHRVAWRKACNAVRGESRRHRHEQEAATMLHNSPASHSGDIEACIDEMIEDLPPELRGLLVMHYLEGRTQQDLAASLGVSQSTVSRQLDTAVERLRSGLRTRGAAAGMAAALSTWLLSSSSSQAAALPLSPALGWVGTGGQTAAVTSPATTSASTLLAMTTTTKILLSAGVAAAAIISIPLALDHSPAKDPRPRPAPPTMAATATPNVAARRQAPSLPAVAVQTSPRTPVSPAVQAKVDGILRRHAGMSVAQLTTSEEFLTLVERFNKILERPETQRRVEEAMTDLQNVSGVQHGMLKMDFDALDHGGGRAWLEAVVSDDEQLMEDWIIKRLSGATFELALDPHLPKTSDGVSFTPSTVPGPKPTSSKEED